MATTEKVGIFTYVDDKGNTTILYPVTNMEAVDGLPEATAKFVQKSNVVNNFTTTEEGFVADARALKLLNDSKLSMELLWENASPYSDFAAQTTTIIGLSECASIAIEHKNGILWTSNWKDDIAISSINVYANDSVIYGYTRRLNISGNTITWYDAYNISFGSNNVSKIVGNSLFLPLRIYGIKGESK